MIVPKSDAHDIELFPRCRGFGNESCNNAINIGHSAMGTKFRNLCKTPREFIYPDESDRELTGK